MAEVKTLEVLEKEGFDISKSQYDKLAEIDLLCNCSCSVYEVLKILQVLKLI